jgi:Tfp pilus assembly protein PilN
MRALHLHLARDRVRAETLERGTVTWAAEAPYATPGELAEAVARLAGEAHEVGRRVVVEVERPLVQLRTLTDLPPVSARALPDLVAHQAGRFFRRNGHPLVTDAAWLTNGSARVARAAAVEEPVVQAVLAGARAAGLEVQGIAPVEHPGLLSLLPVAERAARRRHTLLGLKRLAAVAACVWLGVGLLYSGRLIMERRAVEREVAGLREPVDALLAARRQLRHAQSMVRAVSDAERLRGTQLALLAAVASALPDSAVLTSLTVDGDGRGVLTGAARRAADVAARLGRSRALVTPRLEGAVVREAIAGREWERFTIRFGPP